LPGNHDRRGPRRGRREKLHDGIGDRRGDFVLELTAPEFLFLNRIGDVSGLYKYGWDLWKLENHKRGLLNGGELHPVYGGHILQEEIPEVFRGVHGLGLKHVQDDGIRFFLGPFSVSGTANDIGQVFVSGQDFRRFVAGPAQG